MAKGILYPCLPIQILLWDDAITPSCNLSVMDGVGIEAVNAVLMSMHIVWDASTVLMLGRQEDNAVQLVLFGLIALAHLV